MIRLPDGTQLSFEEAAAKLDAAAEVNKQKAIAKGQTIVESEGSHSSPSSSPHIVDPALLVYDIELLDDIGKLLVSAAVLGTVAAVMKLPPAFGFLLGGMMVGPLGLNMIRQPEAVGAIAQFGSVFPLFASGMQFHVKDQAQNSRVRGSLSPTALLQPSTR